MTTQSSIRTIQDLLEAQLGTSFIERENPEGIDNIDTAVKDILRPDPSRVAFLFVNLSSTDAIFLRPSGAATTSNGVRVPAGGSAFTSWREDGTTPAKGWSALTETNNNQAFYLLTYSIPGSNA